MLINTKSMSTGERTNTSLLVHAMRANAARARATHESLLRAKYRARAMARAMAPSQARRHAILHRCVLLSLVWTTLFFSFVVVAGVDCVGVDPGVVALAQGANFTPMMTIHN